VGFLEEVLVSILIVKFPRNTLSIGKYTYLYRYKMKLIQGMTPDLSPLPNDMAEASQASSEATAEKMDSKSSENDVMTRLDLITLISRMEWRLVLERIQEFPEETQKKQLVMLDGEASTMAFPLHLAVSKKPPVCFFFIHMLPTAMPPRRTE
jgi:hypothetical protein